MTPEEMKDRSRGFGVEMTPEALTRRLDKVSQLRSLGLALRKARLVGPVEAGGESAPRSSGEGSSAGTDLQSP